MRQASSCLVFLAAASIGLAAQGQPPALKTATTGVVIDVSVLDSNGQPVLDLTPEDFELAEDGKRQQLVSVTLVRGGVARVLNAPASAVPAASGAAPSTTLTAVGAVAAAPATDSTPSVTAILFDRLSPEMRAVAGQAALAYVATLSPPHDYAGVFLADATFRTLQTFTNQAESLRQGVARVASTAPMSLAAGAERAATTRVQAFDPNQPQTAGAESGQGFSAAERQALINNPNPSPEVLLRRLELKMTEGYQRYASEYEGQASLTGLRATVDALAALPGRKSVLYFTENLQVTSRLKAKFEELIGRANRANITVYPVDAAGLRVHSEEAKLGRNVGVAGSQGIGDEKRGEGGWTKDLEHQEQVLSSRPGAVLGRLAKDTGGFLLDNTNNLAAGVARMQQERTTYYLLTYQPVKAMDGKFRRVGVKVKRPRVTVRARPGYLAAAAGIQ